MELLSPHIYAAEALTIDMPSFGKKKNRKLHKALTPPLKFIKIPKIINYQFNKIKYKFQS